MAFTDPWTFHAGPSRFPIGVRWTLDVYHPLSTAPYLRVRSLLPEQAQYLQQLLTTRFARAARKATLTENIAKAWAV
jgi:hypothetical protein